MSQPAKSPKRWGSSGVLCSASRCCCTAPPDRSRARNSRHASVHGSPANARSPAGTMKRARPHRRRCSRLWDFRVDPVTASGADTKVVSSRMQAQGSPSPRLDEESTPDTRGVARIRARSDAPEQAGLATQAQPVSILSATDSAASDLPIQDHIEASPLALKRTTFTEAQVQFEDGCPTSLGGIFYLIHVLLRSDLLSFDVGLRGWALLELLWSAASSLWREGGGGGGPRLGWACGCWTFVSPGAHPGADFEPAGDLGSASKLAPWAE